MPDLWARSTGRAARVTFTTPNRLASIWALKSSGIHLLDRGAVGIAGIVDHDVEAPEIGLSERNGRFGSIGIGHVEGRRAEPLAVLVRWLLDVFRMAGRGKHRVTALQDGGHEFSAEAT